MFFLHICFSVCPDNCCPALDTTKHDWFKCFFYFRVGRIWRWDPISAYMTHTCIQLHRCFLNPVDCPQVLDLTGGLIKVSDQESVRHTNTLIFLTQACAIINTYLRSKIIVMLLILFFLSSSVSNDKLNHHLQFRCLWVWLFWQWYWYMIDNCHGAFFMIWNWEIYICLQRNHLFLRLMKEYYDFSLVSLLLWANLNIDFLCELFVENLLTLSLHLHIKKHMHRYIKLDWNEPLESCQFSVSFCFCGLPFPCAEARTHKQIFLCVSFIIISLAGHHLNRIHWVVSHCSQNKTFS